MAKEITNNQIGVMIEGLGDKIKGIAEGQKVLEERVGRIEIGMGELRKGQEVLKNGQYSLNNKMDKIHVSLKNEINITFTALNEKLDEHSKQPAHI